MGLHEDAVVVDCHNDLILLVAHHLARGEPDHMRDYWIPALRSGGVDVQVVPIYIEREYFPEGALRRGLLLIEILHREVEKNSDELSLCRSGVQIDEAVSQGKIAIVLALEGCDEIGQDVAMFGVFHRLGVRMASFTHFDRSLLADGTADDQAASRLPRAGVAAVKEMERLGMLVDVSHLGAAATDHVLEIATRPVIASHSSARALVDHHRNLTDDRIKGIAATGGVVGVNFFPGFIDSKQPTIDRLVDHIEHVSSVAGIDHVGIGPDFIREYADLVHPNEDPVLEGLRLKATIEGLVTSSDLPALTERLVDRGLAEDQVRKVLGENFLRVFREVMKG